MSAKQTLADSNDQKFFFKVTLDAPLRGLTHDKLSKRKTAITEKVIEVGTEVFKGCDVDSIQPGEDLESSDFFDTIILNNEED